MSKAEKLGRSAAFGSAPRSARSAAFARATGAQEQGERKLALADIADNPENPRGDIDLSHPKFVGLKDSISVIGLTSPIAVCRAAAFLEHHPQHQELLGTRRYVLLAGHRRVTAARLVGLQAVPGTIDDSGAEDPLVWALAENGNHENLDPIQQARALAKLTDPAPHGKGLSQRKVAKAIGKSQPYISQMKVLLNLVPELQEKVSDGSLSQPDARPIARLEQDQQWRAYEELVSRAKEQVPKEEGAPEPPAPADEEASGDNSVITQQPQTTAPQPVQPAGLEAPDTEESDKSVITVEPPRPAPSSEKSSATAAPTPSPVSKEAREGARLPEPRTTAAPSKRPMQQPDGPEHPLENAEDIAHDLIDRLDPKVLLEVTLLLQQHNRRALQSASPAQAS
ncbi:ParB/RepB/Spo0J family partition protein [Streptomyces mauvecolor]